MMLLEVETLTFLNNKGCEALHVIGKQFQIPTAPNKEPLKGGG